MLIIGMIISFLTTFLYLYTDNINRYKKELVNLVSNVSEEIEKSDKLRTEEIIEDINISPEVGLYLLEDGEILFENISSKKYPSLRDFIYNKDISSYNSDVLYDNHKDLRFIINSKTIDSGITLVGLRVLSDMSSEIKSIFPYLFFLFVLGSLVALFISEREIDEFVTTIEDNTRHSSYDTDLNSKYKEIYPLLKIIREQRLDIEDYIKDLKTKSNTIEAIISNMKEGMILLDKNLNILSINQAAILLSGLYYEDIELKGKNIDNLVRNYKLKESILNIDTDELVGNLKLEINNRFIDVLINPVVEDFQKVGYVLILFDNTKNTELEKIRREFSANVSHELKTPLTSINGYAEMISSGIAKDSDIKKFAGIINEEGQHLLKMIEDIIKLSRLEESNEELDEDFIDINTTIYEVLETLKYKLESKEILVDFSHGKIPIFNGNKRLVFELIMNIVDNAIKYNNHKGSIYINTNLQNQKISIKVRDTGIGISEQNQKRIFERFYTIDKSHNKKDSSGLGLSIVKHIIKLLDGEIKIKSQLKKGTEFTIFLPTQEH